jgi:hypothetical protein
MEIKLYAIHFRILFKQVDKSIQWIMLHQN